METLRCAVLGTFQEARWSYGMKVSDSRNPEVRYQGQFSSFENQVEDRARRMVTIPRLNTTNEVIRCTFFTNKGLQSNLLSAKTFSFEKYNKTPKIWKTVPKVIVVTPKTE
eukprot:TRINITY_DN193_c0_g1_i12.p2 TRINITY_DN193_c0_g1~~TRINITY_DN193_c0_g1_i12.p2  ORF type:complete len:111 (+),score=9.44 TRINITY_DN193_c0_g1_i12:1403-1735(+)